MATPYASASLYAGDLHPDVTEAMLFEIFNSVGPVASIRVCRDAVTRRSLGYAYINFHNAADAERALDTLNYTLIRGKQCRIMWSHRDPSLRKSGAGNVFVKNLDKSIDNKALFDTFSIFGNILSCKVATDETGQSKGFGFVHYETEESGLNAIAKVNGMLLGQKKVYVGPFQKRLERPDQEHSKYSNIFVKNLAEVVSDDQLRDMFAKFGEITSCVVMRDDNNNSKGFGFINFNTTEAAKAAVDEMNGKDVEGKPLFVGRAQKKAERESELRQKFEQMKMERQQKYQGVNLYVKNMDDTVEDDKLREEFSKFGTITSCRVMKDEKGVSRGFGFVCFSSPDEATKAVHEMNGKLLLGKPLYVALAQRRDVRRAQLEAQYASRGIPPAGMRMQPGMPPQAPMYPGQPVFYPNMPAQARQQGGFMYPQPMMPRPGWRPPAGAQPGRGYAPVPNSYVMPMPQRGPQQQQRRGPGAGRPGVNGGMENGRPGAGPNGAAPAAGRGNRNFKYTANARNRTDQMPPQQPAQHMPSEMAGQEPLTASALAAASPDQQKQMLGERLFPLIHAIQPALAGKITGMLLEMDNSELLMLLDSHESLVAKVNEALQVLEAHGQLGDEPAAEEQQQ